MKKAITNSSKKKTLHLGTFNAEAYWRNMDHAILPGILDREADRVVGSMDELLFPFCKPGDILITRRSIDQGLNSYLHTLGFNFINNAISLENETSIDDRTHVPSICELLMNTDQRNFFSDLISSVDAISSYALIPSTAELCCHYSVTASHPPVDCVKKVNSKIFSHHISRDIGLKGYGSIITSSSELLSKGGELLQQGHILIKDPLGVSGKGNLLIASKQILAGVCSYVSRQERQGKLCEFLIEPVLERAIDFSCQMDIPPEGDVVIHSIQIMHNDGFSFHGIETADPIFIEKLAEAGYFDTAKRVAMALQNAGYHGNACIDSMLLKDGSIVPVVEINARKSMGLINHALDKIIRPAGSQSCLRHHSLKLSNAVAMSRLIDEFDRHGILFTKERGRGIVPLSSGTINANLMSTANTANESRRGRFYSVIISADMDDKQLIDEIMTTVFNNFDINVIK